jgi:hypothetical protein
MRKYFGLISFLCGLSAIYFFALFFSAFWTSAWPLGEFYWSARAAFWLGVVALVSGVAGMVTSRPTQRRFYSALAGLALGAAFVGSSITIDRRAAQLPKIHDITTDTEDPPEFSKILEIRPEGTNSLVYDHKRNADRQRRAYPEVYTLARPFSYSLSFQQALKAARIMKWEIVAANEEKGVIEAIDNWSGIKTMVDEIVIRVRSKGLGNKVDVRSVSRYGASDGGSNARRIVEYLDELRKKILCAHKVFSPHCRAGRPE